MEHKTKKIAELLKILANEHRIMILCILLKKPETVGNILMQIGDISQSALSQHLSILKRHNILNSHKKGQKVTYSIADPHVEKILDTIKVCYCEKDKKKGGTLNESS